MIRKEALRRGYSRKTIKSYSECVKKFLNWSQKDVKIINKKDILNYIDWLIEKKYSGNTINVYYCSLRFFFQEILGRKLFRNVRYTKIPRKLPVVLNREEVKLLIDSIPNEKHALMIKLIYSAGLRVGELVSLRIKDIDCSSEVGWVRNGKGGKDRPFIVSKKIKLELSKLICGRNVDSFLFVGRRGKYSVRTIQEIVKKACKSTGIKKNVHPHTLRHSFATHLIEEGYGLGTVQNLLGHSSPATTMGYVHLANPRLLNVKSPFD